MDTKTAVAEKKGTLLDAEALLRAPAPAPLVPFPIDVRVPDPSRQTPAVGQRTTRPDARLHGLGQTKYIDDFYVPGMLFCNRKIKKTQPHIMDIGPSVLDLFGLPVPGYCDGEPLFPVGAETRAQ